MTLFLGGLFLTMEGLYTIVSEANSYPVVTTTQLVTRSTVTFPAVTVCNLNRINCANLINQIDRLGDNSSAHELVGQLHHLRDNIGCTPKVGHSLSCPFNHACQMWGEETTSYSMFLSTQICSLVGWDLEAAYTRTIADPDVDAIPFKMARYGCHNHTEVKVCERHDLVS